MPDGSLVLRAAVAADVAPLVDMARRSWLSAFEHSAPPAFIERWRRVDREPAWYAEHWPTMTVAERDGVVVGLVQPVENEVNGLWVDPPAQRGGVGSALLRAAEQQIEAAGHVVVWVTCSGFNPGALEFYRRVGYQETGHENVFVEANLVDETIILARRLPNHLPRRRR